MAVVGIICEYNPFHNGHERQLRLIRQAYGSDAAIVCLMSGNFVQRGMPAIIDKSTRAKAAIRAGADLILELPIGIALSSAEGFASGGVSILSRCCDTLCFGTETMGKEMLVQEARALLSPAFGPLVREALSSGCSFPAARAAALRQMGLEYDLSGPNDILGVEYTKAILQQGCRMDLFPVFREGSYHDTALHRDFPSATAVRRQMTDGGSWADAVPPSAAALFEDAPLHTLEAGERAILARLRTMTDAEFEALPYGTEGLWRKLMKASRTCTNLPAIIEAVKSKRYTRTRIDRMILCAFLGLTGDTIGTIPPVIRILGFSDRGRAVIKSHPEFRNAGEDVSDDEKRLGRLYGLFCTQGVESPDIEKNRRIIYIRTNHG